MRLSVPRNYSDILSIGIQRAAAESFEASLHVEYISSVPVPDIFDLSIGGEFPAVSRLPYGAR